MLYEDDHGQFAHGNVFPEIRAQREKAVMVLLSCPPGLFQDDHQLSELFQTYCLKYCLLGANLRMERLQVSPNKPRAS